MSIRLRPRRNRPRRRPVHAHEDLLVPQHIVFAGARRSLNESGHKLGVQR